ALIKTDKIVWVKHFGTTGNAEKTPIAAQTLFAAGQMSEPVMHAIVLKLVSKKAMALDTKVAKVSQTVSSPSDRCDDPRLDGEQRWI
ncbi:hypothetical protein ABTN24_19755, partial [Acinetobacter baumannii]